MRVPCPGGGDAGGAAVGLASGADRRRSGRPLRRVDGAARLARAGPRPLRDASREEPGPERRVGSAPGRCRGGRRALVARRAPLPRAEGSRRRALVPPEGATRPRGNHTRAPCAVPGHPGLRRSAAPRTATARRPSGESLADRRGRPPRHAASRDLDRRLALGRGGHRRGGLPAPARHRGGGAAERADGGRRHAALGKGLRFAADARRDPGLASALRHAGVPRQRRVEDHVGLGVSRGLTGRDPVSGSGRGTPPARRRHDRKRSSPGRACRRPRDGGRERGRNRPGADRREDAQQPRPARGRSAPHRLSGGPRLVLGVAGARNRSLVRRGPSLERRLRGERGTPRARHGRPGRPDPGPTRRRAAARRPPAPRWVAGLFDLRDFSASGRLRARPGFLALSPARAEAGSFALDADYRRAGKNAWGALLVRKGALSLGVRLGSSTAVHLAGAAGWFEEEGRPGGLRTDHPRVEPPALRESR